LLTCICRPEHPNQVSPRFANESLGTGSGKGHGNKGSGGSGDKGVQKGSGKRAHGAVDVTDNEGEKPGKKAKTTSAAAEGEKPGDKGIEGLSDKDSEMMANKIARAKTLKAKMVAAMGEANDIVNSVKTQGEWKWADTEQSVGLIKEIDDLKTSSKMWKDWVTADHKQWQNMMKRQFLPSVTLKELGKIEEFEAGINKLTAKIATMKNMQTLMNADNEA
jgi:hypothetical protein